MEFDLLAQHGEDRWPEGGRKTRPRRRTDAVLSQLDRTWTLRVIQSAFFFLTLFFPLNNSRKTASAALVRKQICSAKYTLASCKSRWSRGWFNTWKGEEKHTKSNQYARVAGLLGYGSIDRCVELDARQWIALRRVPHAGGIGSFCRISPLEPGRNCRHMLPLTVVICYHSELGRVRTL